MAYYVAGPGCLTGSQTNARPDAIVGDLSSFDGPDGLDSNFLSGTPVFFNATSTSSTVASGLYDFNKAQAPATWGVAIDVPLMVL